MPPPDYYRANLERIIHWVESHYGHLVDAPLLGFVTRLRRLPVHAQRLYVRLLMRRGPWFRVDRLAYPEVGPTAPAVLALCLAGLAELAGAHRTRERLALLRSDELADLLDGQAADGWIREARKNDRLAACEELEPTALASVPEALALLGAEQVLCLQLLFFANDRQDLVDFILADLGILRFEPVSVEPVLPWREASQVRRDLRCLDAADELSAFAAAAALPEWGALARLETALKSPATATRVEVRRNRALLRLARCWLEYGDERRALAVLAHASGAPAREAHCRLLASCGEMEAAERLQAQLMAAPDGDAEVQFAKRFEPDRGRCRPLGRTGPWRSRRLTLVRMDPTERIEQVVMHTLAQGGGQALHVENALIGLIVGLAFWDIVFAPLPGAFVHPFQSAPLDLFEAGFRSRRAEAIDARLCELANGSSGSKQLLDRWQARFGTVNALVPWHRFSAREVQRILEALPAPVLACLCKTALEHPPLLRRGFPDLILLGDAPGHFGFIEVKGPGDVLRPEQRRWLGAMANARLPVHVLEVRWA